MVDGNEQRGELPKGWAKTKLRNICQVVRGGSPRPMGNPKYFSGNIPFIKIADITKIKGKFIFDAETKVNEKGAKKSRFLLKGDLILSNSGTVCVPKFLGVDACIHDGFVSFVDLPEEIDKNYLYYFFHWIRPYTIQKHRQGITQVNLNTEIVGDFEFQFSPLIEQQRIVEKIEELFSDLDAGIESLKKARQQLKIYRQAVLKWAFEGKLTEGWREEAKQQGIPLKTAAELLEDIKAERENRYRQQVSEWEGAIAQWEQEGRSGKKPGKPQAPKDFSPLTDKDLIDIPILPKGWMWTQLGEILYDIKAGKSFKCQERPPRINEVGVAKVSAVTWGKYDEIESKTCVEEEKTNKSFLIKSGDFLFTRANTIELVGACVIVKQTSLSIMLSDKTLRFSFLDRSNQEFILHFLRSRYGRNEIERLSTGNQESMRNIGQEKIRKIRIALPSIEEQNQIVEEIESRLSICDQIETAIAENLQRAEALRQSILKRAFAGKLVPQDPNDEPAELLLERIRQEKATAQKPKKKATSETIQLHLDGLAAESEP